MVAPSSWLVASLLLPASWASFLYRLYLQLPLLLHSSTPPSHYPPSFCCFRLSLSLSCWIPAFERHIRASRFLHRTSARLTFSFAFSSSLTYSLLHSRGLFWHSAMAKCAARAELAFLIDSRTSLHRSPLSTLLDQALGLFRHYRRDGHGLALAPHQPQLPQPPQPLHPHARRRVPRRSVDVWYPSQPMLPATLQLTLARLTKTARRMRMMIATPTVMHPSSTGSAIATTMSSVLATAIATALALASLATKARMTSMAVPAATTLTTTTR
jgi:hypothetical protein